MTDTQVDDINVVSQELLMPPAELKRKLPMSETARETLTKGRETVRNILDRKDPRLFIRIGPCSMHQVGAAKESGRRLKARAEKVSEGSELVIGVYSEKRR